MTATLHLSAHRVGATDTTPAIPHVPQFPWAADVPCRNNPDLWFNDINGGSDSYAAKRICQRDCPQQSRDACLRYALEHDEPAGVWGGLTSDERKRLTR